jgi:hypothetical protein
MIRPIVLEADLLHQCLEASIRLQTVKVWNHVRKRMHRASILISFLHLVQRFVKFTHAH